MTTQSTSRLPTPYRVVVLRSELIKTYFRSPDGSKIKQKMVYASSKDALRRSLQGIAFEVQGTDLEEVSYETGA